MIEAMKFWLAKELVHLAILVTVIVAAFAGIFLYALVSQLRQTWKAWRKSKEQG